MQNVDVAVIKDATEFMWDNASSNIKKSLIEQAKKKRTLVYSDPDSTLKPNDVVIVPYGENAYTGIVIQKHEDPLNEHIKNNIKIFIKKK